MSCCILLCYDAAPVDPMLDLYTPPPLAHRKFTCQGGQILDWV